MPGFHVPTAIFDFDGAPIDSSELQLLAWSAALNEHGYQADRDRIETEIGNGGDRLVASILGNEVERKSGDALRKCQAKHARALIRGEGTHDFSEAARSLQACRDRGFKLMLSTSSSKLLQTERIHTDA
ncbi:hypothetical protein BH10PLA1_BH10PLA1_20290 [soil metagenome]